MRVSHWLGSLVLLSSTFAMAQNAHQEAARQLVERQAKAWEKQDFNLAKSDWLPTAVLSSPDGKTPADQLDKAMKDYFKGFTGLHVTIKNVFASPDGNKVALEWDWSIVRKRDGYHGISHDAIIVDLKDGKIASWREYYDPAASGEAKLAERL
jgi:ketosteroid isomerase-like protein